MIGVIVTGHGKFASGMESALKLLAGKPEKFTSVDFRQEDTIDDLEFRLRDAIRDMSECTGILILADIYEGAPYRESIEMKEKMHDQQIEIVAGVNLGMLMQINLSRGYVSDVADLADLAVEEGRKQTLKYVYSESEAAYDD
ncbi:MAG: PTS fructose transporter subunit IIA [Erysipelotrichaceae bacterium]|nr:PTS fructose transporter subunit IIA [Erysipelotrichaceae bacterium]